MFAIYFLSVSGFCLSMENHVTVSCLPAGPFKNPIINEFSLPNEITAHRLALHILNTPRILQKTKKKEKKKDVWKTGFEMKCKWGSPKKSLQFRYEKRLHMPVYMQILLVHMCVNIWQLLGTGSREWRTVWWTIHQNSLFLLFFTAREPGGLLFVLFADIQISMQKLVQFHI